MVYTTPLRGDGDIVIGEELRRHRHGSVFRFSNRSFRMARGVCFAGDWHHRFVGSLEWFLHRSRADIPERKAGTTSDRAGP